MVDIPVVTDTLRAEVAQRKNVLTVQRRGYDAAAASRLNPNANWLTIGQSADAQIFGEGRILREKSRDLVRNNPHAKAATRSLVRNIVGSGIKPRPVTGDRQLDAKVKKLWNKWIKRAGCDADGQQDFYSLQTSIIRQVVTAGEVLIRKSVPKRSMKGYVIPLQLQLLEADYLSDWKLSVGENGTRIVSGIEFAATGPDMGKRIAYWCYKEHPGNLIFGSSTSLQAQAFPIPADDILHIYDKERTQLRGVPFGVAAFTTMQNLAEFELAELVRKKTESSVAAIITTEDDSEMGLNQVKPEGYLEGDPLPPGVTDGYGNPIEYLEPGLIAYARGGKTIQFNRPQAVGGYNEYKVSQLRSIAAAYGVTYEMISGDLSQVNFSSMRCGLIEFREDIEVYQKQLLIPHLDQIWEWFCEAAVLAGELETDDIAVEWCPQALPYINPETDVAADNASIRDGLRSFYEVVGSYGRDPEVVLEEIADYQKRCRELGIVLDSNPGAVNGRGATQKNDPNAPPAEKPKGKKKKKKKRKNKATEATVASPDSAPA